MKNFNGKAIYNPAGKASEYGKWACNFYVGCSNGCEYCYCKKGVLASQLGGNKPTLKKCFKNDTGYAYQLFIKELRDNITELRKHGLFFSFTTDPLLFECWDLTWAAVCYAINNGVPVKVLTKRADWVYGFLKENSGGWHNMIAFGFTLTGHDELEPNASKNIDRIEAMIKLHKDGFKTFASFEPIIDFDSTMEMINSVYGYCDLYKIGLMAGKKYNREDLVKFIKLTQISVPYPAKIYFKDSMLKYAGIERSELSDRCVLRDYNIFTEK